MHGLFDRYTAQPTEAPFDNMTLAYFSVWYRTVSGGEDDETEVTSGRLSRFQLQNGMGTIAQRSCQACLRVPIMTPESLLLSASDVIFTLAPRKRGLAG